MGGKRNSNNSQIIFEHMKSSWKIQMSFRFWLSTKHQDQTTYSVHRTCHWSQTAFMCLQISSSANTCKERILQRETSVRKKSCKSEKRGREREKLFVTVGVQGQEKSLNKTKCWKI